MCKGEVLFNGELYNNKALRRKIENIKKELCFSGLLKKHSVVESRN